MADLLTLKLLRDLQEKVLTVAKDAGPDGPVCAQELEAIADAEIHRRYGIDAVPLILIADADGVVQRHFLGPLTATDLWAAVAEAREPGSTPGSCETHD